MEAFRVNIGNLQQEQLQALDEIVELLDEAAILIRAGNAEDAETKVYEARQKANLIRGAQFTSQSHPPVGA
jgi:hypothetical protein